MDDRRDTDDVAREGDVADGAMAAVGAAGHPDEDTALGDGSYGEEAAESEDAARPGHPRPSAAHSGAAHSGTSYPDSARSDSTMAPGDAAGSTPGKAAGGGAEWHAPDEAARGEGKRHVQGDAAEPVPGHREEVPMTGGDGGTRAAAIALVLLGLVIVAVAAFSTPWQVLTSGPPDPARDFSAAQIARAQAFDAATTLPSYLSLALTIIIAGILVATPFSARVLGRLRGPWWLRVVLGTLVITALVELIRWPLGIWVETILRDYGLSTQDWAGWAGDRLKNLGVEVFLVCVMLLALVALARKVRRWWIPAAVGAFALTVVTSFVYPVVFEPLFNDFSSMRQGPLRTNLLDMAARDGVPVEDVLVADASRRTTALNAYVSGFGATRRIVVYDTLLRAPQREVELVVAHELGHAKYDDVLYGTVIGALSAGFGAIALFLVLKPLRRRTGVTSISDPRAVGVVMGLMTIGSLIMGPAQNVISRHIEARADVHALDLTGDPAMFIAMQKRLAITNISDLSPDAVEYVLYASHPSGPERIAMARAWAKLNGVPEP
ncbi:M48 family metallopeptidase [Nonomuraea rubra]|uniref:STE24 endopeptidase n=1 Tax=Nonomuraea rubra TaxID=46180 RepID=A0A7X0P0E6_9ACTN|nr:M48 family metallopeptidase [Nonomuraea rubra]MBB6552983.1 STE24 endopeptidase [Nonomuraea rubra]